MIQKFFVETYGCQMNQNDTQIVHRIMNDAGYELSASLDGADIVFLNTCSVRENAEERIHNRLNTLYHQLKKRKTRSVVGVLGCMAERMQGNLLSSNQIVSIVAGPDEYRKLPHLVELAFEGEKPVAVDLSSIETYNDVVPVQTNGSVSAYLSIMRGCNNFCSYCIVPYTRGRERSRPLHSIIDEVKKLADDGFKEITLLGQNVNSYEDLSDDAKNDFPELLKQVAIAVPNVWIRFLTSHPRNMSERLVDAIASYDNICNYIHLPVQSGSNRILQLMNRKYTREHYLSLIEMLKDNLTEYAISTDIIAGYPSETLADHNDTMSLMADVRYSSAFMFRYSPREGTKSYKEVDDVPEEEKIRRLNEIILQQNNISHELNQQDIGKVFEILVEAPSKKKITEWIGRTKTAKLVIFDNAEGKYKVGDLLNVKIEKATSATLFGALANE